MRAGEALTAKGDLNVEGRCAAAVTIAVKVPRPTGQSPVEPTEGKGPTMKTASTSTAVALALAVSGCQLCFHGDGPTGAPDDDPRAEETPACRARQDCAAGRDCVNARCLLRCNVNGECPGSMVCAARHCAHYIDDVMPSPAARDGGACDAEAACAYAEDCPAGRLCVNARCTANP